MQWEQIYETAIGRINQRRLAARTEQERRTDEIMQRIPEAVALDRQLRSVCMQVFEAAGKEDRAKRLEKIQNQTVQADQMLRKLLTANGYPADYLDVHYACPLCCDSGYRSGRRCACLERVLHAVSAEAFNQESQLSLTEFDTFSMQYYKDLPEEQYATMERIFQHCKHYAETFRAGESESLVMVGNTGLGKTHLSLAIASCVIRAGYNVIYDSAGALLHKLEQEHFGRGKEETDTLDTVLSCDLLILDDLGTEFHTSFSQSQIYTIVNSRINAHRAIILNSNLSMSELKERYGDRVFSRLLTGAIMQFCGNDIRLKKRQGGCT